MNPHVVRPLAFGPATGLSAPPGRRRVRTPEIDLRPAVLPLGRPVGLVEQAFSATVTDLPRPGTVSPTLDDAVDDILRQAARLSAVLSWIAGFVVLSALVLLLLR